MSDLAYIDILNSKHRLLESYDDVAMNNKHLILEGFNEDIIIKAIQNRRVLYIKYKGDDSTPNGTGYRTIEPVVLGTTVAGNEAVRAYQVNGSSDSFKSPNMRPSHDSIPEYRLFLLKNIVDVRDTGKSFTLTPRKLSKYNELDSQMSSIKLSILPADGSKPLVTPTGDTESVFDRQTQGLKSFYTVPLSQDMEKKDAIIGIYDIVKKLKKKAPENYVVIKKDDQYFAVTDKSAMKYKPEEILGNLRDLYVGYNKPQTIAKTTTEPKPEDIGIEKNVDNTQIEPETSPIVEPTPTIEPTTPEIPNNTSDQAKTDRDNFLKS